MSIYDTIGVRTIINAKGTSTRVSGAFLAEVTAAMQEVAQYCVDMAEIQTAASEGVLTGALRTAWKLRTAKSAKTTRKNRQWRNAAE